MSFSAPEDYSGRPISGTVMLEVSVSGPDRDGYYIYSYCVENVSSRQSVNSVTVDLVNPQEIADAEVTGFTRTSQGLPVWDTELVSAQHSADVERSIRVGEREYPLPTLQSLLSAPIASVIWQCGSWTGLSDGRTATFAFRAKSPPDENGARITCGVPEAASWLAATKSVETLGPEPPDDGTPGET